MCAISPTAKKPFSDPWSTPPHPRPHSPNQKQNRRPSQNLNQHPNPIKSRSPSPSRNGPSRNGQRCTCVGRRIRRSTTSLAVWMRPSRRNLLLYKWFHFHRHNPATGTVRLRCSTVTSVSGDCYCVWPGCNQKAWSADLDHTCEYNHDDPDAGGRTHHSEMKALCRFHHSIKTYSDWLENSTRIRAPENRILSSPRPKDAAMADLRGPGTICFPR